MNALKSVARTQRVKHNKNDYGRAWGVNVFISSAESITIFIDVRFYRIKTIPALKELKYFYWSQTHNIGIQMKRKEETKTFMKISN